VVDGLLQLGAGTKPPSRVDPMRIRGTGSGCAEHNTLSNVGSNAGSEGAAGEGGPRVCGDTL